MSFRSLSVAAVLGSAIAGLFVAAGLVRVRADAPSAPALRVCADPNNLPFSNDRLEGFENRIAALVARDLGAPVEYTWWAQRRGYVRNTVGTRVCDVWMGAPVGLDRLLVTRPYYRSSYVFATRRGEPRIARFDDPRLLHARIGVQLVGDDGQNTPPAHALAARHIVANVVGFTLYGDYSRPNPPARIVDALARGDIDVAVVWGPLAGYFAHVAGAAVDLTPVVPAPSDALPFAFDIGVGVSRRLPGLRDRIDRVIDRRRADIDRIVDAYHVPRVRNAS